MYILTSELRVMYHEERALYTPSRQIAEETLALAVNTAELIFGDI